MPGFPRGAFYALDDDQRLAAFGWDAIEEALGLPRCTDGQSF
jgi:3-phytase